MACRVLGMTSVGDRASVFETDKNTNIGTRTCHMLWFLQNGSLPTRVEFVASLLRLQEEQDFRRGQKIGSKCREKFPILRYWGNCGEKVRGYARINCLSLSYSITIVQEIHDHSFACIVIVYAMTNWMSMKSGAWGDNRGLEAFFPPCMFAIKFLNLRHLFDFWVCAFLGCLRSHIATKRAYETCRWQETWYGNVSGCPRAWFMLFVDVPNEGCLKVNRKDPKHPVFRERRPTNSNIKKEIGLGYLLKMKTSPRVQNTQKISLSRFLQPSVVFRALVKYKRVVAYFR
jgi:hypothetical protein